MFLYSPSSHLNINCFLTEKEERKKVVNAHVDHGTSLSERIKKRKRSIANHKPEDVTDDSASYEGSRGRLRVSFPLTSVPTMTACLICLSFKRHVVVVISCDDTY